MLLPVGDIHPRTRTPWTNWALVLANIGIFVPFWFGPEEAYARVVDAYGFVPARFEPSTLFTSQFLHAGVAHLLGNMLFLWIAGDNIEDRLGSAVYLVFYLVCGLAAGLVHAWLHAGSEIPTIGASGAIAGVLGAYLVWFPKNRIRILWAIPVFVFIHWGIAAVRAGWVIGSWFLMQLLMTWEGMRLAETLGDMPGVAYGAHVGGFVAGAAVAALLRLFGIVRGPRGTS